MLLLVYLHNPAYDGRSIIKKFTVNKVIIALFTTIPTMAFIRWIISKDFMLPVNAQQYIYQSDSASLCLIFIGVALITLGLKVLLYTIYEQLNIFPTIFCMDENIENNLINNSGNNNNNNNYSNYNTEISSPNKEEKLKDLLKKEELFDPNNSKIRREVAKNIPSDSISHRFTGAMSGYIEKDKQDRIMLGFKTGLSATDTEQSIANTEGTKKLDTYNREQLNTLASETRARVGIESRCIINLDKFGISIDISRQKTPDMYIKYKEYSTEEAIERAKANLNICTCNLNFVRDYIRNKENQ